MTEQTVLWHFADNRYKTQISGGYDTLLATWNKMHITKTADNQISQWNIDLRRKTSIKN